MKRKLLLFMIVILTLICTSCGKKSVSIFSRPTVERVEGQRKDWNDVSSFVCYYGEFDIEFQSKFDVIIMHSSVLYSDPEAKEKVKQLKDAGCYIVSYITIEISKAFQGIYLSSIPTYHCYFYIFTHKITPHK